MEVLLPRTFDPGQHSSYEHAGQKTIDHLNGGREQPPLNWIEQLRLGLGIFAGLALRRGHVAQHRTVSPELVGMQFHWRSKHPSCKMKGLLLCEAEGKAGYLDPVDIEGARSGLEVRCVCWSNRKLTPENRIKEETEIAMLVHCFYSLCEAPEEKTGGSRYWGVFPSQGGFQCNTLRATRRSRKTGKITFVPCENCLCSSFSIVLVCHSAYGQFLWARTYFSENTSYWNLKA